MRKDFIYHLKFLSLFFSRKIGFLIKMKFFIIFFFFDLFLLFSSKVVNFSLSFFLFIQQKEVFYSTIEKSQKLTQQHQHNRVLSMEMKKRYFVIKMCHFFYAFISSNFMKIYYVYKPV
jgi:hypothetical protein